MLRREKCSITCIPSNIQVRITYSKVHVANRYHHVYVLLPAWEAAPSPYAINDPMDIRQVQDSQVSLCAFQMRKMLKAASWNFQPPALLFDLISDIGSLFETTKFVETWYQLPMSRSKSILVFLVSLAGLPAHKASLQPSLSRNTWPKTQIKISSQFERDGAQNHPFPDQDPIFGFQGAGCMP